MNHKLLWKFLLIIATGTVALFYLVNYFSSQAEDGMSQLDQLHKQELTSWGRQAEALYHAGDPVAVKAWLDALQKREKVQASIVEYDYKRIAGDISNKNYYIKYSFGRNVDWPIHLTFKHNPLMEVPFEHGQVSFLVLLPDRMRPGGYLPTVHFILQVFLPLTVMALLALMLYRDIMRPLSKLQLATRDFSKGDFSVRVRARMGKRNDELTALADTFDQMASRIGEQLVSQRQLIADLSHELRTPLARLDIAMENAQKNVDLENNLARVALESTNIRRLVEDSLTLAWLENERPVLEQETLDLVDLLDVIIDDARFEFPQHQINTDLPDSAELKQSNHLALGQAIENIVRNALRYTPQGKTVDISLERQAKHYLIQVADQGPGVPAQYLDTIFNPFFRVEKSRQADQNSFGLGLSLARRQLHAVGGKVSATNLDKGGLCMSIILPIHH